MKHSIFLKFLAIALTAFSLVTAVAGVAGIVVMESAGLYVNGLDVLQEQQYRAIAETLAEAYACDYITGQMDTCPENLRENLYSDVLDRYDRDVWAIRLSLESKTLSETQIPDSWGAKIEISVDSVYPIAVAHSTTAPEASDTTSPTQVTGIPETTESTVPIRESRSPDPEASMPDGWLHYSLETVWEQGELAVYLLYYYPGPTYTVTVYLQEQVLQTSSLHLLTSLYPYRYTFILMLALGLVVFAAGLVYLMCAAGHARDGVIRPSGLNRLPLDLYALTAGIGIFMLAWLFSSLWDWMTAEGPHPGNLSLLAATLLTITLLGIAFLFALSAQIKVKNGFWWRNSLLGRLVTWVCHGVQFLGRGLSALYRMLPVVWQWLLTAAVMVLSAVITFVLFLMNQHNDLLGLFFFFLFLLALSAGVGMICYGGYCFGLLITGARKMSQGSLHHKIPTKYLTGSFRDFAQELNALSETAVIAAQNQMRSERMKTELITNVSHDIKTPLTSIINFVDLLQKPHTQEQNDQYLEILSRQSDQMKRLIEDLIELSKANTGNMTVNITRLDAAETVNQALGEFSDKLDAARLTPIFRQPDSPVFINADGRLVWRVLSNLLTNAIKYAMPGTRLYVDLVRIDTQVLLSMKNISREELRQSSEELMERFTQGDSSRNTDGTGLGLNIAQSLMEVQHGKLQLLLDGDLFKVTLSFPGA